MSNVSRSVYQTLAEENKRLLYDIRILTAEGISPERILLIEKWRKRFKEEKDLRLLLKQFAVEYFKEHPELDIKNWIQPK